LDCESRLEALQRIFEHEVMHLAEMLCWERSDCATARFQHIAARFFLHRAHTHDLVTRRELAADSGIRPGSRVAFVFEGRSLTGRVNRITKRATVLVEDSEGRMYSDGARYNTYYVPIAHLEPV
jgi:inactivated superfamily I helicase